MHQSDKKVIDIREDIVVQLEERQKKIKMDGLPKAVPLSLQHNPNTTKQYTRNKEWFKAWLEKNK